MLDEHRLAAAAEQFRRAATDSVLWEDALNRFADATGTRTGQLIALGHDSLVPLNIMTRMPDEAALEFLEVGGGNPEINSRVRVGSSAREMVFLDQADFDVEGDQQRSPEFGAWIDRYDIGYTCITTLVRQPGTLIGFAALRSNAEGSMRDDEKRAFMTLAGHARAAVNLAISLEGQRAQSVASALEHMSMAALILDGTGRVLAMSSLAEQMLVKGLVGRVIEGIFSPSRVDERDRFNRSLAKALLARIRVDVSPPPPCVLTAQDGGRLVAEFVPLSEDSGFAFSPAIMVILKGGAAFRSRDAGIARELFGLTAAETTVAERLLNGRSPQDIAADTGTSVGTVRNHVHRILSKAHCKSQVELLALLRRYGC